MKFIHVILYPFLYLKFDHFLCIILVHFLTCFLIEIWSFFGSYFSIFWRLLKKPVFNWKRSFFENTRGYPYYGQFLTIASSQPGSDFYLSFLAHILKGGFDPPQSDIFELFQTSIFGVIFWPVFLIIILVHF